MRPTGPRVGDKWKQMKDQWKTSEGNHATNTAQSGSQVGDKWETSEGNHATNRTQSGRQVETNERPMEDK